VRQYIARLLWQGDNWWTLGSACHQHAEPILYFAGLFTLARSPVSSAVSSVLNG